jgi:hypothetical protein
MYSAQPTSEVRSQTQSNVGHETSESSASCLDIDSAIQRNDQVVGSQYPIRGLLQKREQLLLLGTKADGVTRYPSEVGVELECRRIASRRRTGLSPIGAG